MLVRAVLIVIAIMIVAWLLGRMLAFARKGRR